MFISTLCVIPAAPPVDLAPLVEQARQEAGLKLDALAALMGISRQALMQGISGERPLSFARLLMVTTDPDGRRFFKALMLAIFEQVGIEDRDQVAALLRKAIDVFQGREPARMAKAELKPAQEEKRIA